MPTTVKTKTYSKHKPALTNQLTNEKPTTAENRPQNLSDDLAKIVAVWPNLPEHIKAAIKVLVQGYAKEIN